MVATFAGVSHPVSVRELGPDHFQIEIGSACWDVQCSEPLPNILSLIVDQNSFEVGVTEPNAKDMISTHFFDESLDIEVSDPMKKLLQESSQFQASGKVELCAEMPGKVVRIPVKEGDSVEEGQAILVLVAMKMENELETPKAGKVTQIHVSEGQNVETGAVLVSIE